MNNLFVSIIVPVYKVERYLPRCIESILKQTYTNFELILVDDGTPDRSGIICDRYAEKDSRIRVVHKENGGVSSARNAGIDVAKGEWLTFIDSDDWVANDYLEVLLNPLGTYDCDMTIGALEWKHIFVSSSAHEERYINVEENTSQEILSAINRTEFYGPWLKLFKAEIIKKNNLRFIVGIALAEDAMFVNSYLKNCNKFYLTGKPIYFYNELNASSVTNRAPYFENMHQWSLQYIQSHKDVLDAFSIEEPWNGYEVKKKAFYGYTSIVRSLVLNLSEVEAKEKIRKLYVCYKGWLQDACLTEILDVGKHRQLAEKIACEDIDYIYKYFEPQSGKKTKSKIKKILRKHVVLFLEKYRDGLIKFKF